MTSAREPLNTRQVFRLLILYRWFSLIPAALLLATSQNAIPLSLLSITLAAAAFVNLAITLFAARLNALLRRRPWLLAFDLLFCFALVVLTDGWNTRYYLYTFSPLLAAAFFFQLRGAMLGAAGMAGLFLLAGIGQTGTGLTWLKLAEQLTGYFVIAGTFGYATTLLARYTNSLTELDQAHRDLEVIHELTLSLQSAADVVEVEERVLVAVTNDLGFPRATIALVDQQEHVLTAWLGRALDGQAMFVGGLPHPIQLRLAPDSGMIAQSLLDGQVRLSAKSRLTSNEQVNTYLGADSYHVFPLLLREHPVGVLLVTASDGEEASRLRSLQAIANQAAVAVGTTMLCIDRAQRLAVQDERIRIAREIHDSVSQSLFGITYSLDACVKLLPQEPDTVKNELAGLLSFAQTTRDEVRQSILDIWPSELTAERFAQDLRRYLAGICRVSELAVAIEIRGDFSLIPPRARRNLYRIAQEALTNIVRHAAATEARVCLEAGQGQAMLTVRDNGRGFDPALAMAREIDRERFGLLGIGERVASLGGTTDILSQPGAGATIVVSVPFANGR
ncbi:MAG: sensor histidine kinase [Chloroflexi bacterium]|nr:sensor histidine kinase [Chloroflexota bacterium]